MLLIFQERKRGAFNMRSKYISIFCQITVFIMKVCNDFSYSPNLYNYYKVNKTIPLMKAKQKKKQTSQSKKKQLLLLFHRHVDFLQIFNQQQLDFLQEKIHIFVFARGQVLAKEKQIIDYVGVITQGRAVSKTKSYQIGDIIGHSQLLGLEQLHQESVTADSDGIIIALRIFDLNQIDKSTLKNKIFNKFVEIQSIKLSKRQEMNKITAQFDQIQQKKVTKYLTAEWNIIFSELDTKQKSKFLNYFPFYVTKQKNLVISNTSKSYLLYVVHGQLIAKSKSQPKIIEAGTMYNSEGFIFGQTTLQNIYCLSSQAIIIVIDKYILEHSFKTQTFKSIMKIALAEITLKFKSKDIIVEEGAKEAKPWSIFKKYPNSQIIPLKKQQIYKNQKQNTNSNQLNNIIAYQTLFRDQLGTDNKIKTSTSLAQSGYDKLYSIKTQPQQKQFQGDLELQRLRKQVQILSQKLKFSEQIAKWNKMELIENKTKVTMVNVLKQIKKLYHQDDTITKNKAEVGVGDSSQTMVSLKQAFDRQMKQNKVQTIVAKCAFRWLYITRKRKAATLKQ